MKKNLILIILASTFTGLFVLIYNINSSQKKNEISITISKDELRRFALLDHQGSFQLLYNIKKSPILIIAHNDKCDFLLNSSINPSKTFPHYKDLATYYLNSDFRLNRETYKNLKQVNILLDESQIITQNLNLKKVGDYVILDSKNWNKIESGNLKNFPQYLNFQNCDLELKRPTNLSYSREIAPILINKCLNCHSQENKILPIFDSYKKVVNWKQMILETIYTDRMPPTSHDNYFGNYKNSNDLNSSEKLKLVRWLENPQFESNEEDPLSNYSKEKRQVKKFNEIYKVKMDAPHVIPPGGEIVYQYFQLGGPTPFDMWIKNAKGNSSNPRQLHHAALMFTSKPLAFYKNFANKHFPNNPEEFDKNMDGTKFPFIYKALEINERNNENYVRMNLYGSGKKGDFGYPKHVYIYLPKGSYLILETHYMGTGKIDSDQTEVTLLGHTQLPKNFLKLHTTKIASYEFTIPALTPNFETVTKKWSPKKDISIISFSGHMHMRGKSIKMIKYDKDQNIQTIISLPKYYYGWHTGVSLKPTDPIPVKKNELLQVICNYDNSDNNPFNPNPEKIVHFGQRVDRAEMCKISFSYLTYAE